MRKKEAVILANDERKQETVKIICLLNKLTAKEQEKILIFMQGVLFAKDYQEEKEITKIVEQIS